MADVTWSPQTIVDFLRNVLSFKPVHFLFEAPVFGEGRHFWIFFGMPSLIPLACGRAQEEMRTSLQTSLTVTFLLNPDSRRTQKLKGQRHGERLRGTRQATHAGFFFLSPLGPHLVTTVSRLLRRKPMQREPLP